MAGAVNKAFKILRLLRRQQSWLTLTEIARSVKIAPSTAHVIVEELLAQGAVLQDSSRRYRLGPATFYMGAGYARTMPIYRGAWSELADLARSVNLTAVIAVPWNEHLLVLSSYQNGVPGIEVAFGGLVPLDAGAWGKAYFAWSEADVPAQLTAHTNRALTDRERYRAEVQQARDQGFAADEEEFVPGASAVASGVTSEDGFEGVVALIGTAESIRELSPADIGRRLAAVASRASYALGDHGRIRVVGVS